MLWRRVPLHFAPCPACNAARGRPLCQACCQGSGVLDPPCAALLGAHELRFVGAYRHLHAGHQHGLTPLGRSLRAFKDGGDRYTGRCLASLFAARLAPLVAGIDQIVPVPADARRLRERGFSPAAWLALALARRSGSPLRTRALRRIAGRPAQRGLGGAGRRANARGAFMVGGAPLRGYSVAVTDDVVTTGATLRDAARCLAEAGASRVLCLALACADEELIARCRPTTGSAGTPDTAALRR